MSGQKRDVQWADGIRGIACLQVVVAHGYEAFGWPETSFDRPYIFQIPFTRLLLDGGYLAVCIFFILSGYVCSIKPLKLAQAGKPEEARKVIASSAFRRLIRLGIPATIATVCSWFLCQMGGFNLSLSLPGYVWLNFHSARPTDWITSIRILFNAILHTWTYDGQTWSTGRNHFEGIQWTMALEVHGSMMVYLALIVTASFTPLYRRLVFVILISYAIYFGDLMGEIPFYIGTLLADLSLYLNSHRSAEPQVSRFLSVRNCWPMAVAFFGLFLASYPPNSPELASWSMFMYQVGTHIFNSYWDFRWAYPLFGCLFLIFAIHFSPTLRRIFSHPYAVFFGSISFPLYLIHGFLMRSLLSWVIFGLIPQSEERWFMTYIFNTIGFGLWISLISFLATLWRDRLDTAVIAFTAYVEEVMLGKKPLLPAPVVSQYKDVHELQVTPANGHDAKEKMELPV